MSAAAVCLLVLAVAASAAEGRPTETLRQVPAPRVFSSLAEAMPDKGRPALLVFFSTGCVACYDDLFQARWLVERGGWPVAIVGVCAGPEEEARAFLEKFACQIPVVVDRGRALFRKHKVDVVPLKVVVLGDETLYRDDPYRLPASRHEELRRCLMNLFSR